MGRAFEFRKERKFKRWAKMAKDFTRIGREIAMAVKAGGADYNSNSRLRAIMQNAKALNMPKASVESAIKKASAKDAENFSEVVYEGYGPGGVAVIIETATDNPTRTVANIRLYFNRNNGSLGTQGCLDFVFTRKGLFKLKAENITIDDLELELIDFGLEELKYEDEELLLYTPFTEFGKMQKALEEMSNIEIISSELVRTPNHTKKISDEEIEQFTKLIDKIEDDDDVINVFHNMDMEE